MGNIYRNGIPYGGPSVRVTSNGDIYIGDQLVRKILTQAEYDLLNPPDPKVEYIIVSAP